MQNFKTIAVCGAGTMGTGIAQTLIVNGFNTIVYELNDAVISKSKISIANSLELLVTKGKIGATEKEKALSKISYTNNLQEVSADLIIEAIIEDIDAKLNLFKALMPYNTNNTIYSSNTSSISINAIAEALGNNTHIVGLHFFNPATIMKLVEVIRSKYTADDVVNDLLILCKTLQKTPVVCNDAPGFIVNRVARHFYLQAMDLVEQEKINVEEIDSIMVANGFKMGPFKLMDLIGLDINYNVSKIVYHDLQQPERLKPSPLQASLVKEGKLGKKTGEGFYKY